MPPKNNAANVAAFRRRQRKMRIVRVELFAHADDVAAIKAFAKQLKEARK